MNNTYFFKSGAQRFEEAFPIGNGTLGAMIYGGTTKEKISLNHDTLWSGHRFEYATPKNAANNYLEARSLVAEGKISEAQELLENHFNCYDSQMYMPLGNIYIEHTRGDGGDYLRTLDMSQGKVSAKYNDGNSSYEHSYFASLPDECLAFRMKATETGALSFVLSFEGTVKIVSNEYCAEKNILVFTGKCPSYTKPKKQGPDDNDDRLVVYSDNNDESVMFTLCIKPVVWGGKLRFEDSKIYVENADSAEVFVTVCTSFIDSYSPPVKEHHNAAIALAEKCEDYDLTEKRHIADFSSLYSRTSLEICSCEKNNDKKELPIDERLKSFDGTDTGLYELIFNFGRYLMISGSRKGSRPLNLQGIWNEKLLPPWGSGYTVNINAEMNYWPAFSCNLAECFEPLASFLKNIVPSGMRTAGEYYGASGFVMHHNADIWAHTVPVSPGIKDSSMWSPWPMASGWLAIQLFDGYEYTVDRAYLAEIYPVMKEAAKFYCEILARDGDKLIISPASSPENQYLTEHGKRVALSKSCTMSQSIVAELFDRVIRASQILSTDYEFASKLGEMIKKLDPYHIGSDGRLIEWDDEYEEAEPEHRHVSHLFSMFPGKNISVDKTPELAEACRKSLNRRGDGGTGWCLGWKTCLYAELGDGNRALDILKNQLRYATPTDKTSAHGGGTFPNLFDAHPPFQIDGNFAASAAIAHMLLQSEIGEMKLLPALPDEWHCGKAEGLVAKGNVVTDICWENNVVKRLCLVSPFSQKIMVRVNGSSKEYELLADKKLELEF